MANPALIKYFDPTFGKKTYEYLLEEREGKLYLCSLLTYQLALELKRTNDLKKVNTRSLPKGWCSYSYESKKEFTEPYYPAVLKRNKPKILAFLDENFEYISRLSDFFDNFSDQTVNNDFIRCCRIGLIISVPYIPEQILQHAFNFVFNHYIEYTEHHAFALLLEKEVNFYYLNFIGNK